MHFRRALTIGGIILGAVLAVDGVIVTTHWPFSRQAATLALERASGSRVRFGQFDPAFFPRPGYTAKEVTFERSGPPLATIHTIRCMTSWPMLLSLTHRVQHMQLEGVHVQIPAHAPPPIPAGNSVIETTVTELVADGTRLDVAPREDGGPGLRFEFPHLRVTNLAKDKALHFQTVLQNPQPNATITASGTFGPLKTGDPKRTPLSGSFRITRANLDEGESIAGLLTATGEFRGVMGRVDVQGKAEVPNFEVKTSHHPIDLKTDYRAVVDGADGNVTVQALTARWMQITLTAHGDISGQPGQSGKTIALYFEANHAPVEDLFHVFVSSDPSPVEGPITFHAHVVLPPGNQAFLRRVRLDGAFQIEHASFGHPSSQEKVDELSARTRRARNDPVKDPQRVTADLSGDVSLRNGTAEFSNSSFDVPGAKARLSGSYNLISEAVDLNGKLAMQASLSRAAGGMKSLFLLPLDPFFKKKDAGAVVAVHIGGTYAHPVFKASLRKR
jgi:autotransporter translocation and assembly factor TamB